MSRGGAEREQYEDNPYIESGKAAGHILYSTILRSPLPYDLPTAELQEILDASEINPDQKQLMDNTFQELSKHSLTRTYFHIVYRDHSDILQMSPDAMSWMKGLRLGMDEASLAHINRMVRGEE